MREIAIPDEERWLHGDAWWRKHGSNRLLPCPAVAIQRTRISAGGFEFDALAAGPKSGELVLLLHGFPQTSACWRDALSSLAGVGYRAVAPDQRGYSLGARPEGVDAYRIRELCDDVLDIARALQAERFHLIGFSFGGYVSLALLERHPARLESLVMVSSAGLDRPSVAP